MSILIAGAGSRGTAYAAYAGEHPDQARIAGLAEPRESYRQRLADACGIPADGVFADWRQAAQRPRFADAVIIATGACGASIVGGHGGGDHRLMRAFVEAVVTGKQSRVLSGPDESLQTHRMAFAAERWRRCGPVGSL